MKRIFLFFAGLAFLGGGAVRAASVRSVPLNVVVPTQAEYVPEIARAALADKMRRIVDANGMVATQNAGQFFLTCIMTVTDKQVIGGAPTKIAQKMEATFYVADALNERLFGSATVSLRGVGDNENKAMLAAVRQLAPTAPALATLIREANDKIVAYYEAECDNIIRKAQILARAHAYEEAFFQLSLVPEQCACYGRILQQAEALWKEYTDYVAERNLAKARSIWNAAQNREAAEEAGAYLAAILPEAKCYPQAQALMKEIAARVKSDIEYDRMKEKWEQENKAATIRAWRDVGVAFGNNQKPITYSPAWIVR